jgi:hypothetical protein
VLKPQKCAVTIDCTRGFILPKPVSKRASKPDRLLELYAWEKHYL